MMTYHIEYEGTSGYLFIEEVTESQSRSNLVLPLAEAKVLSAHLQEVLEEIDAFGEDITKVASIKREWEI